jgi:hypothetical protein
VCVCVSWRASVYACVRVCVRVHVGVRWCACCVSHDHHEVKTAFVHFESRSLLLQLQVVALRSGRVIDQQRL